MSGFANDFGHENGVISTENIMKNVKRHCKNKNVFHARAWQSWRTIQRLKVAQNSEYQKMIRRQKKKIVIVFIFIFLFRGTKLNYENYTRREGAEKALIVNYFLFFGARIYSDSSMQEQRITLL